MILKVAKRLAIRNYLARGWSLIPVQAYSKDVLDVLIPADETNPSPDGDWKQFTRRRAAESQVLGWLEKCPDMNLAVVTGEISGVLVLDVDDPARIDLDLKPWLATCQRVPRVRTTRGYHLYFIHPGVKLSNAAKPFDGMDIRCDDGYAILPPSVSATGRPYAWDVPMGAALPPVPAGLLDVLVDRCGPYQPEIIHPGGSDDWMFDYPDEDEDDERYEDWDDDELFDEDAFDDDEEDDDGDDSDLSNNRF